MKDMGRAAAIIALLVVPAAALIAQAGRQERVAFKAGTSSATIKGSIKGGETVDYVLGARRNQTMTVTLTTSNGSNYFNVLPPGSEEAIAIGSTVGTTWSGPLPADGDYRIRVYLMRNAARRDEQAAYTLSVGVTGRPDAKVAGTPYHATGKVPCSVGTDPKGSSQCSFGVIRLGPDRADVYLASPGFDVALHKDQLRVLKFAGKTVTSTKADEKVTFEKKGDEWSIVVNDFQYYSIPDAVIVGG
jgi:hypothetical protein